MQLRYALFFTALTFTVAASVMAADKKLPSDNYEQPKHRVIEQTGNIEIREYAPMLLAEVDVTGERGSAAREAFRVLAGFIFGGNVSQQRIAMTSPVTQVGNAGRGEKIAMTSPVTQIAADGVAGEAGTRWTVAFMMPAQYTLATLPKPETDRIRFRMTEPERRAVIRFSGFSTASNLEKHRLELEQFIADRKLKTTGTPMMAFYDDPFTLPWNRRNEWWVPIAP
ncbi:MAG: SOUL family heme-binding protein [Betaproteobacteria bacterium]|jgi:hypothetical protein